MSLLLYLASDEPLDEMENPHFRHLSVNEALEMGLENIPEELLAPDFDRDQPDVILWSDSHIVIDTETNTFDDGGFDDDFGIYELSQCIHDIYTDKAFQVGIECDMTPGRAKNILSYIRDQLQYMDAVELWSVWLGGDLPKIIHYEAKIDTLTPEDLMEIADLPLSTDPPRHHCITITK